MGLEIRVCFGDPLTRTRSWQAGQRIANTAWSLIYSYVTSQHFRPVNQILTSNKKATINLLKLLLGLNQFCTLCLALKIHKHVFSWILSSKVGSSLPPAVRDRWPGPRTKWKTLFSNRGTGVTRSWGPSRFSAWPGFGSQDPVKVRVAKTHPMITLQSCLFPEGVWK